MIKPLLLSLAIVATPNVTYTSNTTNDLQGLLTDGAEVVRNGRVILTINQDLQRSMTDGLTYYSIEGSSQMMGSMIEISSDLIFNYITIESDPDFFPITDRDTFVGQYHAKYGVYPEMAFSGPRTKNGLPIGRNVTVNRNAQGILDKNDSNNAGNGGSGFVGVRNGGLELMSIEEAEGKLLWKNLNEGFQERLGFSKEEGNRFYREGVYGKQPVGSNSAPWRWIVQCDDGSIFLRQSGISHEKMYQNIDADGRSVVIERPDGSTTRIRAVVSVESDGCGELFLGGVSQSQHQGVLNDDNWGGTKPCSNVMVVVK